MESDVVEDAVMVVDEAVDVGEEVGNVAENLPGAHGRVVLPTMCPMCRSRVMSDDEFYDSKRSRGLTGDDYCVDAEESSALEPVCCDGCPARAHYRCLGTSHESAHSIDYLYYSSGWYSDPGGWLCPACAPAETRKEKKKKGEGGTR